MSTITVGGDSYEFDFENPSNREVMAIERVSGQTLLEWLNALQAGSVTALTQIVWVCQKRTNPQLKLADVEFRVGDFTIDHGDTVEDEPSADPKDQISLATTDNES
jgi:hypothetical protein